MPVKTTLKNKKPVIVEAAPVEEVVETPVVAERAERYDRRNDKSESSDDRNEMPKKRVCSFCESKKEPTYTDIVSLRKFMSDRARILPKMKTGVCSKHQRRVTKQIKYARDIALLPFVNKI